jgi:hypothetical protein
MDSVTQLERGATAELPDPVEQLKYLAPAVMEVLPATVPRALPWRTFSIPELTVVVPTYEFSPERIRVPRAVCVEFPAMTLPAVAP